MRKHKFKTKETFYPPTWTKRQADICIAQKGRSELVRKKANEMQLTFCVQCIINKRAATLPEGQSLYHSAGVSLSISKTEQLISETCKCYLAAGLDPIFPTMRSQFSVHKSLEISRKNISFYLKKKYTTDFL